MADNGCAYGNVTRQITKDMHESVSRGFTRIDASLKEIKKENKELFNHMSSRVPMWVTILFTILGSLVVGLIVYNL